MNLNNQTATPSPSSIPDIDDVEKRKEEHQKRNEWLKERMEYRQKQQIQFIMTQTNYDEGEATQKLEACNNDVMKVVGEYLDNGFGVAKFHDAAREGKKNRRNKKSYRNEKTKRTNRCIKR